MIDLLDWLVDENVIGMPVAVLIAVVISVAGGFAYWRWGKSRRQSANVVGGGMVQQTNVENTRANGDIEISPRQEKR